MALKIMYRLIVAQNAKHPKDANIKTYDMTEDTPASRNAALTAIGWPNPTNKDPDVTIKQFEDKMLSDNSVDKMTVVPVLVDDVSNKSFYLTECDPTFYIARLLTYQAPEVRVKEKELWLDDHKDVELDIEDNYKKREKNKPSISSSSTSASTSG